MEASEFVACRKQKVQVNHADGSREVVELLPGDAVPAGASLGNPSRWVESGHIRHSENKMVSRRQEPIRGFTRAQAPTVAPAREAPATPKPMTELKTKEKARVGLTPETQPLEVPVPKDGSSVTHDELKEMAKQLSGKNREDLRMLANTELKLGLHKDTRKDDFIKAILDSLAQG